MTDIRIAQFSDTHFLEADAEPEGGFAYDTAAAFDASAALLASTAASGDFAPDLVVATGDIADHGRPAQYRIAADRFASLASELGVAVNVTPGNHDRDAELNVALGRPNVTTSRVVEIGSWCFLFVDSNAGVMLLDDDGRLVDPDYDDRLHRNGSLGTGESAWIRQMCAMTEADHVFVWLHHPPHLPGGLSADEVYADEWRSLLAAGDAGTAKIRGLGGGHTHMPAEYRFADCPVYVCPALKNNFDVEAATMLPPGYRSYTFGVDGSITSDVVFVEDERWPRSPVGRAVMSLLRGELTYAEFDEIVARKRAGG